MAVEVPPEGNIDGGRKGIMSSINGEKTTKRYLLKTIPSPTVIGVDEAKLTGLLKSALFVNKDCLLYMFFTLKVADSRFTSNVNMLPFNPAVVNSIVPNPLNVKNLRIAIARLFVPPPNLVLPAPVTRGELRLGTVAVG